MTRLLRAGAALLFALVIAMPTTSHAALLPVPTGSCPMAQTGGNKLTCNAGICGDTTIPCNYSVQDIQNAVVGVGNWIIGIIGLVVLVLFMYGGFLWVIAGGNDQRIEQGIKVMIGAGIGLVIVFSAGTVLRYVLVQLKVDDAIIEKLPIEGVVTVPGDPAQSQPPKPLVCGCTYGNLSAPDLKPTFPLSGGLTVNTANCEAAIKKQIEPLYENQIDAAMNQVSCNPTQQ